MKKFSKFALTALTALMVSQAQANNGSLSATGTVSLTSIPACVFYNGGTPTPNITHTNINAAASVGPGPITASTTFIVNCTLNTPITVATSVTALSLNNGAYSIPTTLSSSSALNPNTNGNLNGAGTFYDITVTNTVNSPFNFFTIPSGTYTNTYTVTINF